MKMYLISDNIDTVTGMRLAGIEGVVVHEKKELTDAIDIALQDKDIGILLFTEKISKDFGSIVGEVKATYKKPLILEIPDRHGSVKRSDFITSYINEAIGVKL